MKHQPLVRHESLQPLSRDHYASLVQARHLRIAAQKDPSHRIEALKAFVKEWEELMQEHLADEERLLMDLIGEPAMVQRLLDDHKRIEAFASAAGEVLARGEAPDAQWMSEFAMLLHDHVRWEERTLFPFIQQRATAEQLHELGRVTEVLEGKRPRWERAGRPGFQAVQ